MLILVYILIESKILNNGKDSFVFIKYLKLKSFFKLKKLLCEVIVN